MNKPVERLICPFCGEREFVFIDVRKPRGRIKEQVKFLCLGCKEAFFEEEGRWEGQNR